jgi:sugar lactone lactonase YvrE
MAIKRDKLWTWRQVCARLALAGIALAALTLGRAQDTPTTADGFNAAAIKAYRAKNYGDFLVNEKQALAFDPVNPRFIYNVACGEALTGNASGAVQKLNELAARKLDLGAETDDDFAGIRETPEWAGFLAKLAELRKPVVPSAQAFTLDDRELLAAGIAVDERTGDIYVASVRERKIVRRAKSGKVSDFVLAAQDGFMAAASLLIDSQRGLLFASTAAVPFMRGFRKEDDGKAGVFVFDLKTGKTLRKAFLADDKKHFLNALAMDRAGNLYVSDSQASGIYRMKPGSDQLETFVVPSVFRATQGLAFSDDERALYVADFSDGLWALDMATLEKRRVEAPADVWLGGLDGLSRVPGGFISVQIGVKPERVVRLRLDGTGRHITTVDVLESNHPDYSGPIQGAVDGGAFFYVANSQFGLANAETGAFASERAKPTVVLRLPL